MAKPKKTAGAKLTIRNESSQRRDILLKTPEGKPLKSIRLLRGKTATIARSEISEQLQDILDARDGIVVVETVVPPRGNSDEDDKEESG